MGKLLTVSVAAYGVEPYLREALSSLLADGVTERVEVFVIDDGSKDGSLAIAKEFEAKYPDTFHAVHKENGGYGTTVLYGIEHATGKYFKLLDGDDWMDTAALKDALDLLETVSDDVIVTDFYTCPSREERKRFPSRMPNGARVRADQYETSFPHGMWALFYRTELLKRCGLTLPAHTLYTDQIYSTVPFRYAETILFSDLAVYCYRTGNVAQSTSASSRVRHADELLRVSEQLYRFYDETPDKTPYLLCRVSRYYIVALRTLLLMPNNAENRRRLIAYEKDAKERFPAIYAHAVTNNRMGTLVKLLRATHYAIYPLLRFIPKGALI